MTDLNEQEMFFYILAGENIKLTTKLIDANGILNKNE